MFSPAKKSWWLSGLVVAALLLTAKPASADMLHYVVTGAAGSATFDLSRTPTVLSSTGQDFLVLVNNGSSNLFGYNFLLPPFSLEFSNFAYGGGLGLDAPLIGDLQLTGAQMFTGTDSAPVFSTGVFHLSNGTTVTVTAVPEPPTVLLLACGLVGLAIFRKRFQLSKL
jgi:PEP-CTERM motif-containing protein